jgi:DNA helicase HerA-like ATPase
VRGDPAIRVRGLRRTYGQGPSAYEAVRGVDLDVPVGSVTALLGTNGAGKTSTLEVIEGLAEATHGEARVLGLDPLADRAEYADLMAVLEDERVRGLEDLEDGDLRQRARNLGIDRWGVWARDSGESAMGALGADGPRCLVLDLGSLDTREEQALVAGAVLGTLWDRRAERNPVLIVIDEAHNVCPADPPDALTALATDHAVRIAAEGRKFGLYLLVCTQRPQKVQENVISQCDNLVLMRMASEADLSHTGELLSFAPRGLLEGATAFRLGEALVAGKLASHPALIRFGRRVAEEGGGDVATGWASG